MKRVRQLASENVATSDVQGVIVVGMIAGSASRLFDWLQDADEVAMSPSS